MEKVISKVSFLKVGKIVTRKMENNEKKEFVSAMGKMPVEKSYLSKDKFLDDDFASKEYHGGENQAVFFMSALSYKRINEALHVNLSYDKRASLGENIIVENIDENDVCVGDVWQMGESIIEISQPREPCWKLSISTNTKDMTKFIFKSGLSGWYGRVLQEGEVKKNDKIILKSKGYENLTIANLNAIMVNPSKDEKVTKEALDCPKLGSGFKTSLEKRLNKNI